jgi:hypothetical protein
LAVFKKSHSRNTLNKESRKYTLRAASEFVL